MLFRSGDEDSNKQDNEGQEEEQDAFGLAWEWLECARLVFASTPGYEHKLADTLEALGSLALETGTTTYPRPTLTLTLLNSSWSSQYALLHHVWDRSISNPCT